MHLLPNIFLALGYLSLGARKFAKLCFIALRTALWNILARNAVYLVFDWHSFSYFFSTGSPTPGLLLLQLLVIVYLRIRDCHLNSAALCGKPMSARVKKVWPYLAAWFIELNSFVRHFVDNWTTTHSLNSPLEFCFFRNYCCNDSSYVELQVL